MILVLNLKMAISKYGAINEDGDNSNREETGREVNNIQTEESQRYSNIRQTLGGNVLHYIHFMVISRQLCYI